MAKVIPITSLPNILAAFQSVTRERMDVHKPGEAKEVYKIARILCARIKDVPFIADDAVKRTIAEMRSASEVENKVTDVSEFDAEFFFAALEELETSYREREGYLNQIFAACSNFACDPDLYLCDGTPEEIFKKKLSEVGLNEDQQGIIKSCLRYVWFSRAIECFSPQKQDQLGSTLEILTLTRIILDYNEEDNDYLLEIIIELDQKQHLVEPLPEHMKNALVYFIQKRYKLGVELLALSKAEVDKK